MSYNELSEEMITKLEQLEEKNDALVHAQQRIFVCINGYGYFLDNVDAGMRMLSLYPANALMVGTETHTRYQEYQWKCLDGEFSAEPESTLEHEIFLNIIEQGLAQTPCSITYTKIEHALVWPDDALLKTEESVYRIDIQTLKDSNT